MRREDQVSLPEPHAPCVVGPAGQPFTATRPWSPARPETLVICCCDGRWHSQLEEFVQAEISERADLYALPGGPASLNRRYGFTEARVAEKALRFLVQEHELASIWMIAHENCAFYRSRYGPMSASSIDHCQKEDLAHAAAVLQRWFPDMIVRQVYASLNGDRVIFTWANNKWAAATSRASSAAERS
jgi:hypothetical protein